MTLQAESGYAFESTKTYVHAIGLSCAFRQWRAKSHCRHIHGYALKVKLTYGCRALDENGWVQDFGGLKSLKTALEGYFDHRLIVARDDPEAELFRAMDTGKIANVMWLDHVGIEAFAKFIFELASGTLESYNDSDEGSRVWVESCEVSEHEANSAIYRRTGIK